MKKELYQKIEVPDGIEAEVNGSAVKVKGPEGEFERRFVLRGVELKRDGKEIAIGNKKSTKNEKKIMNSIASHIKNMIEGVQKKFEYELKICFSHFPITVDVKEGGAMIKNFLGEKNPRKMKIPAGVEVKVSGDRIHIQSIDKELAGQTAARFEMATKIRNRDRRIFQDGIFMTIKSGKEI